MLTSQVVTLLYTPKNSSRTFIQLFLCYILEYKPILIFYLQAWVWTCMHDKFATFLCSDCLISI